ncbi:MAG: glycine C-acetyltransferase, partial [Gammaproteobacteria bacterium]
MSHQLIDSAKEALESIREQGLYKSERPLESPQSTLVNTADSGPLINLCANNYLGFANHPALIEAAHAGLDSHGFGMASVRFICGTQDIHKTLEAELAEFLQKEAVILFSSCFDANAAIFEVILSDADAVISDSLNHASIIDG